MDILSADFLSSILKGEVPAKSLVSGVVLVNNYSTALTKNNDEYINGNLLSGVKIGFKCWSKSKAFTKLKTEEYTNTPVLISATVDDFGGSFSLVVNDVTAVSGYAVDQFLEQRYNIDAYFDATIRILEKNISENAMKIVTGVFTDEVKNQFKIEFAASSHHDNCKGGLLAHTYKCLSLLNWTLDTYKTLNFVPLEGNLTFSQDRKDLLFLGMLLHDIGKIREMNLGVYQNCSKVTHRYLGIEFIAPFKEYIVSVYGEGWYYDLVSVLLQHHGEWGDPCKTLVSYIISKVDLYESQMTLLQQLMTEKMTQGTSGSRINVDGSWLSVD